MKELKLTTFETHRMEDRIAGILVRQLSYISSDEITIDLIRDISRAITSLKFYSAGGKK